MFSFIIAIMFFIICIMNILLICGLPLGEFTMGGQYKVLPTKLRIMAIFSLIIQIFVIVIVLQTGGYLPFWFSEKTTRVICFVFAGFFSLNTIMNACSKSKKEKCVMTPMSLLAVIYFGVAA